MSNPYLIQVPFALNGDRNDIQVARQQGQDPEDATWNVGFPPQTMIPESAGGLAPKGLDFNGLFYAVSSIGAHYSRGDQIQFDATFAAKIGGYSKGFRLASNDYQRDFISLVDSNMVDPNGTNISQNWRVYAGQGSIPVATSTTNGTVKLIDSLSSDAKDAALTASQGRVLQNNKLDKTGNAVSATKLQSARSINGVAFDGTKNIDIPIATSTNMGTARFATAAEVANKANVMAAVTPKDASLIAASTGLGVGQSWRNLTSSRVVDVNYKNNTEKPIMVCLSSHDWNGAPGMVVYIDSVHVASVSGSASFMQSKSISVILPPNQSIRVSGGFSVWSELG